MLAFRCVRRVRRRVRAESGCSINVLQSMPYSRSFNSGRGRQTLLIKRYHARPPCSGKPAVQEQSVALCHQGSRKRTLSKCQSPRRHGLRAVKGKNGASVRICVATGLELLARLPRRQLPVTTEWWSVGNIIISDAPNSVPAVPVRSTPPIKELNCPLASS